MDVCTTGVEWENEIYTTFGGFGFGQLASVDLRDPVLSVIDIGFHRLEATMFSIPRILFSGYTPRTFD